MFTTREIEYLRAIHQADQDAAHWWRHEGILAQPPVRAKASHEGLSKKVRRFAWGFLALYAVGGAYSFFALLGYLPVPPWSAAA